MAKVMSHFKCLLCESRLAFPQNCDIVDFTISFLKFYKDHDRCEKIAEQMAKAKEKAALDAVMPIQEQEQVDAHQPTQSTL